VSGGEAGPRARHRHAPVSDSTATSINPSPAWSQLYAAHRSGQGAAACVARPRATSVARRTVRRPWSSDRPTVWRRAVKRLKGKVDRSGAARRTDCRAMSIGGGKWRARSTGGDREGGSACNGRETADPRCAFHYTHVRTAVRGPRGRRVRAARDRRPASGRPAAMGLTGEWWCYQPLSRVLDRTENQSTSSSHRTGESGSCSSYPGRLHRPHTLLLFNQHVDLVEKKEQLYVLGKFSYLYVHLAFSG
jgi:hypothetical protein